MKVGISKPLIYRHWQYLMAPMFLLRARGTNRQSAHDRFAVWSLVLCWRSFRFSTYTINALFMISVYKIWLGVTMGLVAFRVSLLYFVFAILQCACSADHTKASTDTFQPCSDPPTGKPPDDDCRLEHSMSIIMLRRYYYIQASNVTINLASTTLFSNFGTAVPSTASSDNGFDHSVHSTAVPTAPLA